MQKTIEVYILVEPIEDRYDFSFSLYPLSSQYQTYWAISTGNLLLHIWFDGDMPDEIDRDFISRAAVQGLLDKGIIRQP